MPEDLAYLYFYQLCLIIAGSGIYLSVPVLNMAEEHHLFPVSASPAVHHHREEINK